MKRGHPAHVLIFHLLVLIVTSIGLQSCAPELVVLTPVVPSPTAAGSLSLAPRTKTVGCISANSLPDAACTPGAIIADATREQICAPGYSTDVRNVPSALKEQVYEEYGIASHEPGQYEVDHLIPLELGGSNDIANLWPEPAEPRPGFHEKDQLENDLHDRVCAGALALKDAQRSIASDWVIVFKSLP